MKHFLVNIFRRYAKNSFCLFFKIIDVLVGLFTLPALLSSGGNIEAAKN